MREIITEATIPMGDGKHIFSAQRVIIQVRDEAGGPYLAIRGENDEPESDEENPHEFYLQTEAEIDEFAAICKRLLAQAEKEG